MDRTFGKPRDRTVSGSIGGLWEPVLGRFWHVVSHAYALPKAGVADLKGFAPLPLAPYCRLKNEDSLSCFIEVS